MDTLTLRPGFKDGAGFFGPRRGIGIGLLLVLLLAGGWLAPARLCQATLQPTIPLLVENPGPEPRARTAVSAGIPVPLELALTDAAKICLQDESGRALPLQTRVLARWGGRPDDQTRPVKWLKVDFAADLPAQSRNLFYFRRGPRPTGDQQIELLEDDRGNLKVDTGAAIFHLSRRRFTLLSQVEIEGRRLLDEDGGGLFLFDESGNRYSGAEVEPESFTICESGPLLTVIEIQGGLERDDGEPGLDGRVRLSFFAGSSSVRIEATLANRRPAPPGVPAALTRCLTISPATASTLKAPAFPAVWPPAWSRAGAPALRRFWAMTT